MTSPNTGALSAQDIELLMRQAGFPASEISTGVGVVMAESGANPNAFNGRGRDESYGLFQINMKGDLGPDRRRKFGIKDNKQLFDPSTNVKAAYIVWKESGWKAWTTYTSGKYKGGLSAASEAAKGAAKALDPLRPSNIAEKVVAANPITSVSDAVNNFGKTMFKTGINVAGILVAVALLAVGIILLVRTSDTTKKIVSKAADVAGMVGPGKVAKIASKTKGLTK